MKIPIRNLYYLLLYAWDRLETRDIVSVDALASEQPVDLLAFVLARATEAVMKRGLDRGYVEVSAPSTRIRGKIDFGGSARTGVLMRRQLLCRFDSLEHDVLHNRILKTTLRQLAEAEGLDLTLRGELLRLYGRMDTVNETRITGAVFNRVGLDRNNRFYRLLMSVCALVHEGLVVNEDTGRRRFFDFERDETKMRLLFQYFVRNLLRRRLPAEYTVAARRVQWQHAEGDLRYLPTMNTDVVVERGNRSLVIETKYTARVLMSRYEIERARPEHLYQLFAYLQNYAEYRQGNMVGGLLLYPRSSSVLNVPFSVMGHPVRLATLDLDQDWEGVERDLVRFSTEWDA